jgi:hypothetical protein
MPTIVKMRGSHFHPNSLLLIVLAIILIVGSALCIKREAHFDGHVLCRIGNGKADVPVKYAEVKLMEGDRWF